MSGRNRIFSGYGFYFVFGVFILIFLCYTKVVGDVMSNKFNYKKSLGQNFLYDENICKRIVDSASIDRDTLVIEIGPGGGAISKYIIDKCGYLVMYEIDERLISGLDNLLCGYNNYEIIVGDFLKEDIKEKIDGFKYKRVYVVANLPYYITTPIITKLIDDEVFPDKIVIMIQKEVASRLSATVGGRDYGSLTVFLNYYYDIKKLFDVSRNCFMPKPNVDSAVICMDLKNERFFIKDIKLFKRVVRDSFRYKRKNLRNNLKEYDLEKIENVLKGYGFDLGVRAEELSLDIFIDIVNSISDDNNSLL